MRMEVTRGVIGGAQKVVVYGPEGIGKSTFASMFPDPLFIDTEGSTKLMDVARLPKPTSWTMLMEEVRLIRQNPAMCQTLVIDTADWAEQLCVNDLVAKAPNAKEDGINGIEGFGYGKGYTYLAEEFGRLLNLLNDVIDQGVNVGIAAHAIMRKFEQPDETGSYDRWELKLQKKTASLLKEWADMVLFANYKTNVINVDGKGVQKGTNKARGGKRVMYTTHHPCWDAKNRHGLPEELDFDYAAIEHCITKAAKKASPEQEKVPVETLAESTISDEEKAPAKQQAPEEKKTERKKLSWPWLDPLFDLMIANNVAPLDIQKVVAKKGYYPIDMQLEDYDQGFVNGVLIAAWPQVYQEIIAMTAEDTFLGGKEHE